MKKMKKLASLALALVMALALAAPAFASGNNSSTITVKNATVGETYAIYKIFEATYSPVDTTVTDSTKAAYTISETSKWYAAVNAATDLFTLSPIEGTNLYNVEVLEKAKTAANVTSWLKGVLSGDNAPEADATKDAPETAVVEFTGLGYGYFLVKSSLNDGALLTLTNANPNETILDKNQQPGFKPEDGDGKKITAIDGEAFTTGNASAEIGDTVEFEINYTAMNYNGEKQISEYTLTDTMPAGLTLNESTVQVTVTDTEDHTITGAFAKVANSNNFTITIPWVNNDKTSKYGTPATIKVVYTATVNDAAAINGDGNTNTVDVTYKYTDETSGGGGSDNTSSATVYTYALAIKKVNKEGGNLSGAKFVLKNGNEYVPVKAVTGADGVYTVDSSVVNKTEESATVISPDSGLIVIKGLKEVDYTLEEIAAPAGYNRMAETKTVTPTKDEATTVTTTVYLDEHGKVTGEVTTTTVEVNTNNVPAHVETVVNFTGAQLPETGGIGTTIFYVLGGVLVAGSAILLVTKKRMGE